MLMPARDVWILVTTRPVVFRKEHDYLAPLIQSALGKDLSTGIVFVLRSKLADRLKTLFWDGTGLVVVNEGIKGSTFT